MGIRSVLTDSFGHLAAMLFPWPEAVPVLAAATILAATALRNQIVAIRSRRAPGR